MACGGYRVRLPRGYPCVCSFMCVSLNYNSKMRTGRLRNVSTSDVVVIQVNS